MPQKRGGNKHNQEILIGRENLILYGLIEKRGKNKSTEKESNMPKKRPPLVTPVKMDIKPNYPFKQVTLDTNKIFDETHIRNVFIRRDWKVLTDMEKSYSEKIEYISKEWHLSDKNIEHIIQNYPNQK